ncbi:MAG: cytochrome P450, partial [Ilumatobacteraceae bacterium]
PDVVDRRALDLPEILTIIQQLIVGGNETTTKMLGEMMRNLALAPELWQRLRTDPSLIPNVVEEAVRFCSPIQAIWRAATQDVELGGVLIPKGSRLVIVFGSANRDETVFVDGDAFDPDRAHLSDHLGFGRGVHFCVGASLARLEGRVALEELTRRVASISLADTNEFTYHDSFMLRGLLKLDLHVVPA